MNEGAPNPKESLDLEALRDKREEALLEVGRMRIDADADPRALADAEERWRAADEEYKASAGSEIAPIEVTPNWQFEKPGLSDFVQAGMIDRAEVSYEEAKDEPERPLSKKELIEKLKERREKALNHDFIENEPEPDLERGVSPQELDVRAELANPNAELEEGSIVGSYINWESQGAIQFAEPKLVTGLSEDGKWVFVEGAKTGIPIEQIKPSEAPSEQTPEEKEEKEEIEEAVKVEEEVKAMPEAERKEVALGLGNIGFKVEKWKNEQFAKAFDWIASTNLDQGSTVSRFTAELRDTFKRDAERAEKKIEGQKSSAGKKLSNAGYLFGNIVKYGRVITDWTGYSLASPLRYVMMSAMAFTRGAEAATEARLKNEKVVDKTRIADEEKAFEEAMRVYENAKAKTDSDNPVSTEALKQSYLSELPKSIQERLDNPETSRDFISKAVAWDINKEIGRLNANIEKAATEDDKQVLLRGMEKRLRDYDRLVSQSGTIDMLAMSGRWAQTAGKAVVGVTIAETLALLGDKLFANYGYGAWERLVNNHSQVGLQHGEGRSGALQKLLDQKIPKVSVLPGGASDPLAHTEIRSGIPSIESSSNVEVIHKGGSVSSAVHDMVKRGLMTKEEMLKAWNNSTVEVHGEKIPISKAGLVFEGNEVKYVPGVGSEAGHFEVIRAHGADFGSDKDLYKIYDKIGKHPPAWLEKSVLGHVTEAAKTIGGESLHDEKAHQLAMIFRGMDLREPIVPDADELGIQLAVLDRWNEATVTQSLLEQQANLGALAPIQEHFEKLLSEAALTEESHDLIDGIIGDIRGMRSIFEITQEGFLSLIHKFGIKDMQEYTQLLGNKNLTVGAFIEKLHKAPDPKLDKFVSWLENFKPLPTELKMTVDDFARSKFFLSLNNNIPIALP